MAAGYYKDFGGLNPLLVSHMSQQNAIDFEWFNGRAGTGSLRTNGINVGAFNDPRGTNGDGSQNCGDSEGKAWLAAAAKLWGYTSGPVLLCDLGFTRDQSGVSCTDTTNGANNDFIAPGDWQNDTTDGPRNLDNFWSGHLQAGSTDIKSITANGGEYRLFLDNFKSQCRVSAGGSDYTIQEFADGSTTPTATKYGSADRDRGPGYVVTIYDGRQMSCRDIASVISDPNSDVVKGYMAYLKKNGGKDTSVVTSQGCKENSSDPACATANQTSCVIDGTGWLVCTVARTLASAMDGMFNLLELFLKVEPLKVDTHASDNTLYKSWGLMRNFANIAFVIAFLIIILSQVSSIGIDNYNIKKMLPRLIVAAILVNVSYWICALAVDISNILGVGLKDTLIGMRGNLGSLDVKIPGWEQVIGWLLGGATVYVAGSSVLAVAATSSAAAIASAALWIALPAILGAILAVFVAFAILAARQALIIILIILSPLAFVAFLLPNTEKLFTMWRKSLTTMLIFYPIFSVLFAGAQLASLIVLGSIGKGTEDNPGPPVGHMVVLAMFIQVAPLILTPLLIKFSGSTIGRFAGMINNKNKGLIDRAKQVRSRKVGILGQQALNATPNTFRRGVFKGRRTAGGLMQSIGQSRYDSKKQDEELKSVLDGEISTASNTRRSRQSLIERAGRVEDAQRDMKTLEEQIKETSRPVTVDARLRLNEQELAETKKEAEKRWADMRAQGAGFTVDPALGLGARQTANMVDLATRANANAVTGTATDSAIKLAQGIEAVNYAKQIQNDAALAQAAGGIDVYGASKAKAMATSTIHKQFDDAVLAEKSTMSSLKVPDLQALVHDRSLSEERRSAAVGLVGKNGGMRDVLDTINDLGSRLANASNPASPNYDPREAEILSSMQKQFFADGAQKIPVSMSGPSKGDFSTGSYMKNLSYEINDSFTSGKYSGEKLAGLSPHELNDIAAELSRNAASYSAAQKKALKDSIQEYNTAAIALGKTPPPEIAKHLSTIESAF